MANGKQLLPLFLGLCQTFNGAIPSIDLWGKLGLADSEDTYSCSGCWIMRSQSCWGYKHGREIDADVQPV
jgi:hypothetical protein